MPPKRRTNQGAKVKENTEETETESSTQPDGPEASGSETSGVPLPGSLAERGWRRKQLPVWTPPVPRATGIGVAGGGGWFGIALATGNVEPGFVWPSLAFVGMGMAYDLIRRFLDRKSP